MHEQTPFPESKLRIISSGRSTYRGTDDPEAGGWPNYLKRPESLTRRIALNCSCGQTFNRAAALFRGVGGDRACLEFFF
jgi:hypothetical protein